MKRPHLILIVSTYPYLLGEPYLENELKQIAPHFEDIHLLQTEIGADDTEKPMFFMPPHARIQHSKFCISKSERLLGFRHVFNPLFWKEVYSIKKDLKLSLTAYKFKTILSYLIRAKKWAEVIDKYIQSAGIDANKTAIYTYWQTESTLGALELKAKYPNLKVISRTHGWDIYSERSPENYLPFRAYMLPKADHTLTVSQKGVTYLANKYARLNFKHSCLYLGTETLKTQDDTVAPESNTLYIVSLSRIVNVKRLERLVHALAQVDKSINIVWQHLGGGEGQTKLEAIASEGLKNASNVRYSISGELAHEEIKHRLINTYYSVLVSTSESEGLPVSMMEAASCYIPLIGTDVGGVSEIIIDNKSGYLIPHEHQSESQIIQNLKLAIERLAKLNSADYQALRVGAHQVWAERFETQANAKAMLELLKA